MTISSLHKHLVQRTFTRLAVNAEDAAHLFYYRLCELEPRFRHLIDGDLLTQERKLMQRAAILVASLDQPEILIAELRDIDQRCRDCGMHDYTAVQTALLWTLERQLGSEFTPGVKIAWKNLSALLCEIATVGDNEPSLLS